MRKTIPVMVTMRCKKHLRLILESAKCLAVKNPVTVSLINSPDITLFFCTFSPSGMSTVCRIRIQKFQFLLFHLLSDIHKHILYRTNGSQ